MSENDRYQNGLQYYSQGRYAEAIAELDCLQEHSGLVGRVAKFYRAVSHRALGIEALSDGRFSQAEQHLRAVVGLVGVHSDLSTYLASLYARTGRHGRCAEEMERVCEQDHQSAEARRKLALAQWRDGRRPEAYMTLMQAIRQLADPCKLHIQLGLFHAAEEQYEQARECLLRAIDADCSDADGHYYLALVAAARSDTDAALKSFQRAFELRPDNITYAYQLAMAAKAAQQAGYNVILHLPEPATVEGGSEIRQLARYVCEESDFVDAFLSLPPSDADEELFGLLAGVLQMALDEHPNYADIHYHFSRVLERLGNTGVAIEHLNRAVTVNPRYVRALVRLGELYAETRHTQEAIEFMQRAIECGGDWPDVHCTVAELLKLIGRPVDARDHLRRALQLNASYTRAAEALSSMAA